MPQQGRPPRTEKLCEGLLRALIARQQQGSTSAQPDPHPGSPGGQINKTINDQEKDEAQSLLLIKYNTRQNEMKGAGGWMKILHI